MYYWNQEKNEKLKQERGISFEEVIPILEKNEALAVIDHENQVKYPGQKILFVEINNYVYRVPYVMENDDIFFKTMIPTRKGTRLYQLK